MVAADVAAIAQFDDILRDELNVKAVELVELAPDTAAEYGITHRLTVNARAAGPRLGKQVQQVIQAARAGDWSETRRRRDRAAESRSSRASTTSCSRPPDGRRARRWRCSRAADSCCSTRR